MDSPSVTALEHYELCIDEGNDPCEDNPAMQSYMARWDEPRFFDLLGDVSGKSVLDVGIGTGRVARKVLKRGCAELTGIDIFPKTIHRADVNLKHFHNVELLVADIHRFLRPGGHLVVSIDHASDWLDFGTRMSRFGSGSSCGYMGRPANREAGYLWHGNRHADQGDKRVVVELQRDRVTLLEKRIPVLDRADVVVAAVVRADRCQTPIFCRRRSDPIEIGPQLHT